MTTATLTAEDIVAAYEKTGLKPIKGVTYDPVEKRGCALAALYFADRGIVVSELPESNFEDDIAPWADERFDECSYAVTRGFDGEIDRCDRASHLHKAARRASEMLGLL
jgi:hypothetical protein